MPFFSLSEFLESSKGPHTAVAVSLLALSLVPVFFLLDRVQLLTYVYPLCAFVVGFWLYAKTPRIYVGFTLWIWFVTPFVRRLLDYDAGAFDPVNPVMLGPLLATLPAALSLFRFGSKLTTRVFRPFLLLLSGILYGYLVGAVSVGMLSATYDLLSWLLPVLFGLHIAFVWRTYPSLKTTVRTTAVWGLLLMGGYGVYQYFMAPAWDMMWLLESEMWLSMGLPEATQFRVFSTLNSTGPFAFVACGLLLLLLNGKGTLTKFALVPGYIAFLLTLVRSAWLGWIVGITYLVFWKLHGRLRTRLLGVLVATVMLGIPLFLFSPMTQDVTERAQTFTNLEEDASANARLGIYARALKSYATTPLGTGLGAFGTSAKLSKGDVVTFDSGVFDLLFSLGWLGSLCYVAGLFLLFRQTAFTSDRIDSFEPFLHAVMIAYAFMLLSINQFTGLLGMIFWTMSGLALAARLHAKNASDQAGAPDAQDAHPETISSPRPQEPALSA